ncbi:MAG: DUF3307 domain-containing protein [Anaerolineales bacterium]|nr:DUF3307 domain-containing protein [Anaerolineales bacterium]
MFYQLIATPTEVLVWAAVLHLVADWLLQTEWMALHKTSLRHAASWAHAGVYALCMALVFPLLVAILIGLAHLLVDTRAPVHWWMRTLKGMSATAPGANVVEIGVDQSIHVIVIALAALAMPWY